MPIPAIRIDDPKSRGLPRQAVPLRLAYLITGLSFDNFLFLLAKRQEGRYEYLTGYQYAAGAEPREVRREDYERILNASPPDATEDELIARLPRDQFVWSNDLADAFSLFLRDCPGYEAAQDLGRRLLWNPALPRGLDRLIEDCVDLSALASPAASRGPDPRIVIPDRALRIDAEGPQQDRPIWLLHLSDLHFTNKTPVRARVQWLLDGLKQGNSPNCPGFDALDYLVISGDFTDKGSTQGLEKAREFVSELLEAFNLSSDRCILVPGNHDVVDPPISTWLKMRRWFQEIERAIGRDPEAYSLRFKPFSNLLFRRLLGRSYPEQYAEQGWSVLFPETGIQFLSLNSCWQINAHDYKRSGVHPDAVANAITQARKQVLDARVEGRLAGDQRLLRIAVWHHAVTGREQMEDTDFLGHLQAIDVRLILHGDVHEMQRDLAGSRYKKNIQVVGAGSFGARAEDRPESTSRLLNVLAIARDLKSVRVHTRQQRKSEGVWECCHEWYDLNDAGPLSYYDLYF